MWSRLLLASVAALIIGAMAFLSGCTVDDGAASNPYTSTTQPSMPPGSGFDMPQ